MKKLNNKNLCSGYGVFPGGKKCKGCTDCKGKPMTMAEIQNSINDRSMTVKKAKIFLDKLSNKKKK